MRLADESGYTMVEVIVGSVLALVVMMAALMTLDRAFRINKEVTDRIDATQRGRQTMDVMTRQLRSAVCPDPFTAALVAGSDSSVTFFADLSDGSRPTEMRTLTYSSTAGTITELRYAGVGASPNTSWPTAPTTTRVLVTNVVADTATPVFRFNAFDNANPPRPTIVLPTPLSAANIATATRITITYLVRPWGVTAASRQSATLTDQVDLRSADPNQPKPAPQCT